MFSKVEDERITFDTPEGQGLINYNYTCNYYILNLILRIIT